MPGRPLETLYGASLQGPPITKTTTPGNWAGRTTLSSGSTVVTISTAVINSDSLVLAAVVNVASIGTVVTSYAAGVVVNSIVSGVSFAVAAAPAIAYPADRTIAWMIWRTS